MFSAAVDVYRKTKKKHDLVFNSYVMRPLAAPVVALLARTQVTPNQVTFANLLVFIVATALLVLLPTRLGGILAVLVLEASYCLDCADGMLARYKERASRVGHLLDFFTDELKAELLVASVAVRLFRTGGFAPPLTYWPSGAPGFLLWGIAGSVVVASACALTSFLRRPEVSGKPPSVEAHYETAGAAPKPRSLLAKTKGLVFGVLRGLNHYPTHLLLFAAFDRFDAFFWMYLCLNAAYLAQGWLGLVLRLGARDA